MSNILRGLFLPLLTVWCAFVAYPAMSQSCDSIGGDMPRDIPLFSEEGEPIAYLCYRKGFYGDDRVYLVIRRRRGEQVVRLAPWEEKSQERQPIPTLPYSKPVQGGKYDDVTPSTITSLRDDIDALRNDLNQVVRILNGES